MSDKTTIEIYECPADGCNYTGPADSVAGHFGGSRDDSHNGNMEVARQLLDNSDPLDTVPTGTRSSDARAASGGDAAGGGGRGSDGKATVNGAQTADTPPSEQPSDGRSGAPAWDPASGDRDAVQACPECGTTDVSNPDTSRVKLAGGQVVKLEDTDRYCENCDVIIDKSGNSYK